MKCSLKNLKNQVNECAAKYARDPSAVQIIAVSKTRDIQAIQQAYDLGLRQFAENYLQEALPKINALQELNIQWHFIGAIQTNKTRAIAQYFQWAHGVDSFKVAERLSSQRPSEMPDLNVCLQVNVDAESTKAGINPNELTDLADKVLQLPRLKLRGLMTIAAPKKTFQAKRESFHRMKILFDSLLCRHQALDTLSMGMSDDFCAAVAEGATMIRIGTAIFGPR